MSPLSRLRRTARRAAPAAVVLVAALAAAEGLLRLLQPAPARHYVWPPGLRVDFEPTEAATPGVTGTGRFRTNSLGLRSDEPFPDARRIVYVLGGSTAADLYLDQDEAWVQRVQTGLNRLPGQPRTWVGNLARPSLATVHHLLQIERLLPELPAPDLLVGLVGVNDLQLALKSSYLGPLTPEAHLDLTFALRPAGGSPWHALATVRAARLVWRTWGQARLGLVQTRTAEGYARLRACRQAVPDEALVAALPDLREALGEYRQNLETLLARAGGRGLGVVFLTQPTLWTAAPGPAEHARLLAGGVGPIKTWCAERRYYAPAALAAGMQAFNGVLREVCRERRLPCLDLAAAVPPRAELFYDDMHFSEAGARLVADLVVRHLQALPPAAGR